MMKRGTGGFRNPRFPQTFCLRAADQISFFSIVPIGSRERGEACADIIQVTGAGAARGRVVVYGCRIR